MASSKDEFTSQLADALDIDPAKFQPDLCLEDIEWDSLAIISTIAIVDSVYGKMLNGEKVQNCQTFADLLFLIENS
ncbi:acyl carrier protein [bacterium]|nr:acyl carrier protein [bacterium]